ncbi:hypothetical protein [Streptomyces griseosporeus]|uniref:hypothetical protein n=1 Tax=Streptomyces griseosporeus TaxID=1910 RepID=UPI0036F8FBFD
MDASGWTQSLLSAYANNCAYVPPAPPTSVQGGAIDSQPASSYIALRYDKIA